MGALELRHLAVVAATAPPDADAGAALAACCARAAVLARAAFALVPGLKAFSWIAPGVDRLPGSAPTPAAAADAARLLAETAAALGADLRVCGRTDDLPPLPAPAHPGRRQLLWFRHYSGREEIVRAATRFFAAHPGRVLGDDELDGWLDTVGVADPDLVVYAGGAFEPHDALLWQASYAELWHTPTAWPEFGEADLRRAVADFGARDRRYGR